MYTTRIPSKNKELNILCIRVGVAYSCGEWWAIVQSLKDYFPIIDSASYVMFYLANGERKGSVPPLCTQSVHTTASW